MGWQAHLEESLEEEECDNFEMNPLPRLSKGRPMSIDDSLKGFLRLLLGDFRDLCVGAGLGGTAMT